MVKSISAIMALLCVVFAYFSHMAAAYIGWPDGYRSTYMRCAEPIQDQFALIPIAAAIAFFVPVVIPNPSWKVFFGILGVFLGALLAWEWGLYLNCGGLEDGTGG